MKVTKQAYTGYKDREYVKYMITIPKKDFRKLGWNDEQELEGHVAGDVYVLKPKE